MINRGTGLLLLLVVLHPAARGQHHEKRGRGGVRRGGGGGGLVGLCRGRLLLSTPAARGRRSLRCAASRGTGRTLIG